MSSCNYPSNLFFFLIKVFERIQRNLCEKNFWFLIVEILLNFEVSPFNLSHQLIITLPPTSRITGKLSIFMSLLRDDDE